MATEDRPAHIPPDAVRVTGAAVTDAISVTADVASIAAIPVAAYLAKSGQQTPPPSPPPAPQNDASTGGPQA